METSEIYNNRYSENYRQALNGYEIARWTALDHFIQKVVNQKETNKVLDYGSGSGLFANLWKKVFSNSELNFADISSVALDKLQKKFPEYKNNTCLITDNKTTYPDNTFDTIVSIEVMEHVENLDAYLKEIFRILKPNGKFVWTTPCGNKFSVEHIYSRQKKLIENTKEGYRRWKWEEPTHLRRLKSNEIKQLLLELGYKSVFFRFRAHFFSFVCTKLSEKKYISQKFADKLMKLDYKLFRCFSNGASMIGLATK